MSGDRATPPVMSAKEIVAALQESQIKLYRHLKHLTSVGLIRAHDGLGHAHRALAQQRRVSVDERTGDAR